MSDFNSVVVEEWDKSTTETSDGKKITFSRDSNTDYYDSDMYEEIKVIVLDYGQLEYYIAIDVVVDEEQIKLMRAPQETIDEALEGAERLCEVYNNHGLVGLMVRN
jgi:hypothetical protein